MEPKNWVYKLRRCFDCGMEFSRTNLRQIDKYHDRWACLACMTNRAKKHYFREGQAGQK